MAAQLNVLEAHAILLADAALEATHKERVEAGIVFGIEELDAWLGLVESAKLQIALFDKKLGQDS